MNSHQVADRAKITYRQLESWVRKGWLKPARVSGTGRGGMQFDWIASEAQTAILMGELVRMGIYPDKAHKIARGDRRAIEGILAAVAPCMGNGELRYRWFAAP